MTSYTFESFDYTDVDIFVPKDTVFYRGLPSGADVVIRDVPMYVSSKHVAREYGGIVQLKNKTDIRLIDVRKLRNLLRLVITSQKERNADCMKAIFYLTIAFGLSSYKKQVKLMEQYVESVKDLVVDPKELDIVKRRIGQMKSFPIEGSPLNPYDPEGVRIAETYIDGMVMLILRKLFKDVYDGFIAPKMFSPFHEGNATHEEIVIFDPIKSQMKVVKQEKVKSLPLRTLLDDSYLHIKLGYDNAFERKMVKQKGGNAPADKNLFYEDLKAVEVGKAMARAFANTLKKRSVFVKPSLRLYDA